MNDHSLLPTMTGAMALNLVDWMDSSLQGLGVQTYRSDSLWWRLPGGSPIYLGAVILDGQTDDDELFASLRSLQETWGSEGFALYDCWATRDLARIGFTHLVTNPWHLRLSSPPPLLNAPKGLIIESVTTVEQLAEFERASWVGFEETESVLDEREQFTWHAPSTLDNPGMHYLNARLDGQVVASVIAHATNDMLGIYGLSTLPQFRRRGFAAALVRAVVALRPDLPACVFPDPPSVPIYTSIGFAPAGEIAMWNK